MRARTQLAFGWLGALVIGAAAHGQDSSSYETVDGVTYLVTHRVVQKSIPTTEYQAREQKVYHPQLTTQYQSYQQTYLTPVTEYQWVSRVHGWWNPLSPPYYTTELAPVTRWQAVPSTVQVPVSRTDWVEETRTTQVPVTTYRTVQEEQHSRVAVSAAPAGAAGTMVASRPIGGQRLDKDPPSGASPWASSSSASSDYRR